MHLIWEIGRPSMNALALGAESGEEVRGDQSDCFVTTSFMCRCRQNGRDRISHKIGGKHDTYSSIGKFQILGKCSRIVKRIDYALLGISR